MRGVDLPGIEIDFKNLANPRQKSRQLFPAELVTISANDDVTVLAHVKMRVAKSPDVEALRFGFRRCGLGFRNNQ
jgi:hypothetical protein